ncbi:MAG: hypothetical protein BWZ02_01653 [Lentisphaerae bacterium ADurb.BinA184]|nr:MAG: hypothetical protein BWZ02_01653 [Lentisphaerae bacterium ADurb.BinA184]
MNRVCEAVFRFRNQLAALPLLYALVSTRGEYENDWVIWVLASLACAAGVLIRAWAVRHNKYAQGDRKTLATTGPYALVRNPLYIGNMLILGGATIASELTWLLPLEAAWAYLVYTLTVAHEERRLNEKYGEAYRQYCERVPRWVPQLHLGHGTAATILRQSAGFLLLLPFLLKELNLLEIWPHH